MAYRNMKMRPGGNVMDYEPRDFADFVAKTTVKDQTLRDLYEAKSLMGLPSPVQSPYAQMAQAMQGAPAATPGAAPARTFSNVPRWGQAAPPAAITPFTPAAPAAPETATEPAPAAGPSRSEKMLQQMRGKQEQPAGGTRMMAPERGATTGDPVLDERLRKRGLL